MKAMVQRVTWASVTVGGEQISTIGRGICVLLGISLEDTQKELEHMVWKILNLRVFEDEGGKHWSKSVMDKQYEVLCVSQFTLQCVLKGNKPDFHLAMPAEQAESFYQGFLEQLRKAYRPELIKGRWGPPGNRVGQCPQDIFQQGTNSLQMEHFLSGKFAVHAYSLFFL